MRLDATLTSIRRDILAATNDDTSLDLATALVADKWCTRREQMGASPASVAATASVIFHVGAELAA